MKTFIKSPCRICGKLISNCGFAYTRHEAMHERADAGARMTREEPGDGGAVQDMAECHRANKREEGMIYEI